MCREDPAWQVYINQDISLDPSRGSALGPQSNCLAESTPANLDYGQSSLKQTEIYHLS